MPDELEFVHQWIAAKNHETAPTLLLLHGTGGDKNDLIEVGSALRPDANLLSPRGRVLEGEMARFFRRVRNGVFDEDSIRKEAQALSDFISAAAQRYGFDVGNLVTLGFSNGANMAASLMLLHPQTLCCAVLWRAQVPLELGEKPDLSHVKVLIASGEYDPIVPIENARQLAANLRECGADVTHEWQDAGHNLTNEDIVAARDWLAKTIRYIQ